MPNSLSSVNSNVKRLDWLFFTLLVTILIALVLWISVDAWTLFVDAAVQTAWPPPPRPIAGDFMKIRKGMTREEVWTVLGPADDREGHHLEMWLDPTFEISIWYNQQIVESGTIELANGKKIPLGN